MKRYYIAVLCLVCLLVACNKGSAGVSNKSRAPSSVRSNGEIKNFSGNYPAKWPSFLKVMDGSFVDNGGEIYTDPKGTLASSCYRKETQDEVLAYYEKLLNDNGVSFHEETSEAFRALRVTDSAGAWYISIKVGINGFLIDKSPGTNQKDWVCFSFHVYPSRAPR